MTAERLRHQEGQYRIRELSVTPPPDLLPHILDWKADERAPEHLGWEGKGVSGLIDNIHGHVVLSRVPNEWQTHAGLRILLDVRSKTFTDTPTEVLDRIEEQIAVRTEDLRLHPVHLDHYVDIHGERHKTKPALALPLGASRADHQAFAIVGWHGRSLDVSLFGIDSFDRDAEQRHKDGVPNINPNKESDILISPRLISDDIERFFGAASRVVRAVHRVYRDEKPHGVKGRILNPRVELALASK